MPSEEQTGQLTMTTKSIHGTVTTPIVLGTKNYGARLTITSRGAVIIPTGDGTAITAPDTVPNAFVKNAGLVEGGAGSAATLVSHSLGVDPSP
jgi:hypothetical protein